MLSRPSGPQPPPSRRGQEAPVADSASGRDREVEERSSQKKVKKGIKPRDGTGRPDGEVGVDWVRFGADWSARPESVGFGLLEDKIFIFKVYLDPIIYYKYVQHFD